MALFLTGPRNKTQKQAFSPFFMQPDDAPPPAGDPPQMQDCHPASLASGLLSIPSSERAPLISLHLTESLSQKHSTPHFNHALE